MDNYRIEETEFKTSYYKNDLLHRDNEPAVIYSNGVLHYYQNGVLHREDGPAIINPNGTFSYYKNGLLHRDNGPAINHNNGTKEYYQNGLLHREDGPAIEWLNGDYEYFVDGKRHRIDGPAVNFGDKMLKYYQNGLLHRVDGPAIIHNGDEIYYQNGKLHRDNNLPAIISNGSRLFYKNGTLYKEEAFHFSTKFQKVFDKNGNPTFIELTDSIDEKWENHVLRQLEKRNIKPSDILVTGDFSGMFLGSFRRDMLLSLVKNASKEILPDQTYNCLLVGEFPSEKILQYANDRRVPTFTSEGIFKYLWTK